jgi:hypothetical protein
MSKNKISKSKRGFVKIRYEILRLGGVVPQGHGADYEEYLALIVKYKDKVQSPLNCM